MVTQERAIGHWSKLRSWKQAYTELRNEVPERTQDKTRVSELEKEKNKVEVQLTRENKSV